MSLNLTLGGVDLYQTPTELTLSLVGRGQKFSQQEILKRYLKFVQKIFVPTFKDDLLNKVVPLLEKDRTVDEDTFVYCHFDDLQSYVSHKAKCEAAIANGETFYHV